MNLWVRTLRQLTILAVALFFFSCEDETSLLGFKNPNNKFHVGYVDIPLNVSRVFVTDTITTDLRPVVINGQTSFVDGLLVGQYQDPQFGNISSKSFLPLYPTSSTALQTGAVFDSITVQFRLNFYYYGFSGQKEQRFFVHELTGDTLSLFNGNRYYANSAAPQYSSEPLGEAVANVNSNSFDTLANVTTGQDTIYATSRLTDEYGLRVFEAIKAGFGTTGSNKLFKAQIKGLALIPGTEPGVIGMNVVNNFGQLSRVIVHYHTTNDAGAVADTLSRTLGFEFASFTKIDADRTGTELAAMQPYESVEPLSGQRYIQSGSPVVTKLDLTPFYNFADTVDNILVNSAQLVINNVTGPDGMKPHGSLLFRLMNNNSDLFLNNKVAADRELATQYLVLSSTTDYYFFAATDGGNTATLSYNDQEDKFSGFITLFTQSLFANKDDADGINENRLRYLALYPSNPPVSRSVTQTLFSKDNVSLRIFYTRANTVTP
jgi:hypothetical protein